MYGRRLANGMEDDWLFSEEGLHIMKEVSAAIR
jgi:hypothetical protein